MRNFILVTNIFPSRHTLDKIIHNLTISLNSLVSVRSGYDTLKTNSLIWNKRKVSWKSKSKEQFFKENASKFGLHIVSNIQLQLCLRPWLAIHDQAIRDPLWLHNPNLIYKLLLTKIIIRSGHNFDAFNYEPINPFWNGSQYVTACLSKPQCVNSFSICTAYHKNCETSWCFVVFSSGCIQLNISHSLYQQYFHRTGAIVSVPVQWGNLVRS